MSSFLLGKEAGLAKIAELIAVEVPSTEIFAFADEVIHAPLEKNASQEDVDYSLGVEAAFFGFLKEACDFYGMYDVETPDDHIELVDAAFAKTAGLVMDAEGNVAEYADYQEEIPTVEELAYSLWTLKQAGLVSEDDLVRLEAAGLLGD